MKKKNPAAFNTKETITWCKGCGNFGLWTALKNAFVNLEWKPDDATIVYGVGCHGHMVNYLHAYGFEGLHGRALPVAEGIKLGNHKLNVLAIVGDGDCFGEGGNHFLHAARRNINMTVLIHDNQIYGLTVGEASPTSLKKFKTRSSPYGVVEEPVNPVALAITSGATFVARSFAGDINHLTEMIEQGIRHKGFSVIDAFQPCVTFNYLNTYKWFYKKVEKLGEEHDPTDKAKAIKKSYKEKRLPVGIFYKEDRPSFEEELLPLRKKTLLKQPVEGMDMSSLMDELK